MTTPTTRTPTKYTLGEFVLLIFGGSFVMGAISILMFPILLLTAWIRMTVYEWFAPQYLHLPHIAYWEWVMIGLFLSLFHSTSPTIKDEYLKSTYWQTTTMAWALQFLTIGLAWGVHRWVLR